jgi:vacuolar protein sorting-associated protein 72
VFLNRSEEEGEDEVDSDFSIEENDEPVSDQDDDQPKKKRRIITKAYKVY